MRAFVSLLAAALFMTATCGYAAERKELSCIQDNYSVAQHRQVDLLLRLISSSSFNEDEAGASDKLADLVYSVASECASALQWNKNELSLASLYEISRMFEEGQRRHGPLGAKELTKLDAALTIRDRSEMWGVLERQAEDEIQGKTSIDGPRDAELLNLFLIEAGFGLFPHKASQVGEFLGIIATKRVSARLFSEQ